jgi:hypothetical protein
VIINYNKDGEKENWLAATQKFRLIPVFQHIVHQDPAEAGSGCSVRADTAWCG